GQRHQAEHALQPGGGVVDGLRRHARHDAAVRRVHPRARQPGQRGAHVVDQHALEALAVAALQEDLAVAAEEHAVPIHGGPGLRYYRPLAVGQMASERAQGLRRLTALTADPAEAWLTRAGRWRVAAVGVVIWAVLLSLLVPLWLAVRSWPF